VLDYHTLILDVGEIDPSNRRGWIEGAQREDKERAPLSAVHQSNCLPKKKEFGNI
jgi:hypothetical protein